MCQMAEALPHFVTKILAAARAQIAENKYRAGAKISTNSSEKFDPLPRPNALITNLSVWGSGQGAKAQA
jgi:hypothetical protein